MRRRIPTTGPTSPATRPGREPVRVEVLADGALWVDDARNEHPLDFCNASAVPGSAPASWWIPVVPRTLQFTVQTNLLPDTVHAGIDATGWQEVVDQSSGSTRTPTSRCGRGRRVGDGLPSVTGERG